MNRISAVVVLALLSLGYAGCSDKKCADGDPCGTGQVCLNQACIAACVPGLPCTPTATAAACKTYATACSARLTATSCEVGGNQADGTACGTGLVCSSGTCAAACAPGALCTPVGSPDPCKIYATVCTLTLALGVCAPVADQPAGTTCGTSTCQANGTCLGELAPPTLSPAGGSGAPGFNVMITGPDPTSVVYYTTDGTAPSDAPTTLSPSFGGSGTVTLQTSTSIHAFATLGGKKSATVVGLYEITPPPPTPPIGVSLGSGFMPGSVQLNGSATLVGTRLGMTPASLFQTASAFFPTALNIQTFTTDFSFQIFGASADGLTFTIQGNSPYVMGSQGGGLGYGPDPYFSGKIARIDRSVAVKFDTFNNEGEGPDSTGIFTDGTVPSIPAVDLAPSGIDLHSGHVLDVHIVYDGSVLTLTVTDKATTPVSTFKTSFPVDIPAHVGDVAGYVGFTASTGDLIGNHQILNWTYTNAR